MDSYIVVLHVGDMAYDMDDVRRCVYVHMCGWVGGALLNIQSAQCVLGPEEPVRLVWFWPDHLLKWGIPKQLLSIKGNSKLTIFTNYFHSPTFV